MSWAIDFASTMCRTMSTAEWESWPEQTDRKSARKANCAMHKGYDNENKKKRHERDNYKSVGQRNQPNVEQRA
eukprot:4267294-Alexandrium_andersonii.AAC.1